MTGEPMVWRNQKLDKHLWAFVYYCRRQGDWVYVDRRRDGTAAVVVYRGAT